MGYPQTVEQLNDIIEEFDIDDGGTVNMSEFMKIMRQYKETDVLKVRDKFMERDADRSGSLSLPELKQALLHLGHTPSMHELKALFKELCGDKEEVAMQDLQQMMNSYRTSAR